MALVMALNIMDQTLLIIPSLIFMEVEIFYKKFKKNHSEQILYYHMLKCANALENYNI